MSTSIRLILHIDADHGWRFAKTEAALSALEWSYSAPKDIKVTVENGKVTLTGNVHSLSESDDARKAAWRAPGVVAIENNLKISQ